MRAWQVKGRGEPAEVLELCDGLAPPAAQPGFLALDVRCVGIGLPDVFMCRGSYALTPKLPFTPGQELVGVVREVPEGAEHRVGDRVVGVSGFMLGCGGFAEQSLVIDDNCFIVADDMTDAEAAGFVIPYHTAYVGLARRGGLREGETLLVLGASGGTGSAAVMLGRSLGARVIATAGGSEKCEFVRGLGAEVVIDYKLDDIAQAVREATDGRGVEIVYDPVGGDAYHSATRCIAPEGRVLVVGFASGSWPLPDPAHMVTRNYSVVGVMPGGYDRPFKLRMHEFLVERWRRGELRVPIHAVRPFEELPDALAELASGGVIGKSMLQVSEG
jgi:NADPH2:quinone reductase